MFHILFLRFMQGYRTYLVAAIGVVLAGLHAQGYIDDHMYQTIVGLLTALGLATLRAGIK